MQILKVGKIPWRKAPTLRALGILRRVFIPSWSPNPAPLQHISLQTHQKCHTRSFYGSNHAWLHQLIFPQPPGPPLQELNSAVIKSKKWFPTLGPPSTSVNSRITDYLMQIKYICTIPNQQNNPEEPWTPPFLSPRMSSATDLAVKCIICLPSTGKNRLGRIYKWMRCSVPPQMRPLSQYKQMVWPFCASETKRNT